MNTCGMKRSCNATFKAEVTCFLTLTNQTCASILWCRSACDQPCLIGQRSTSALTVALQDLFKPLYKGYASINLYQATCGTWARRSQEYLTMSHTEGVGSLTSTSQSHNFSGVLCLSLLSLCCCSSSLCCWELNRSRCFFSSLWLRSIASFLSSSDLFKRSRSNPTSCCWRAYLVSTVSQFTMKSCQRDRDEIF